MAATPTDAQVLGIRVDLETYLVDTATISDYSARALAQLKRDLEDTRGIKWAQVYVEPSYLDNTDNTGTNDDRCKYMIALLAVAYVFEDYAIMTEGTGTHWWDLYLAYRSDYDTTMKRAKLDVDIDDSGTIEEGEEGRSAQAFMVR